MSSEMHIENASYGILGTFVMCAGKMPGGGNPVNIPLHDKAATKVQEWMSFSDITPPKNVKLILDDETMLVVDIVEVR